MKLRSTLLACACLLLMGSLANAAAPAAMPATPANEAVAAQPSAEASPGCPAADLPFLSPAPTDKADVPCGACSDTLCQGKNANAFCAYRNGQVYTCLLLSQTCSDGATRKCFCYLNIP
jgi:hypothetical protein